MPEIYLKKNVYWIDRKKSSDRSFIYIGMIGLVLLITIFSLNRKAEPGKAETAPEVNLSEKNKSRIIKTNRPVKILQCDIYEEELYKIKNKLKHLSYLFYLCDNSSESREIENYYNFHFNGNRHNFKMHYELSDDIRRVKNLYCFSGGKAQIALDTEYFPKCVEFENMNMNNFSYTNIRDPNIYIKVYIYKVSNNKIHLLALQKKIINEKFIKKYINLENFENIFNDTIYAYTEDDKKFLRICNLLQDIDYNQIWFEISWNPQIQNMLCFKNFKYIN